VCGSLSIKAGRVPLARMTSLSSIPPFSSSTRAKLRITSLAWLSTAQHILSSLRTGTNLTVGDILVNQRDKTNRVQRPGDREGDEALRGSHRDEDPRRGREVARGWMAISGSSSSASGTMKSTLPLMSSAAAACAFVTLS
jgi:hypothetical protein